MMITAVRQDLASSDVQIEIIAYCLLCADGEAGKVASHCVCTCLLMQVIISFNALRALCCCLP